MSIVKLDGLFNVIKYDDGKPRLKGCYVEAWERDNYIYLKTSEGRYKIMGF